MEQKNRKSRITFTKEQKRLALIELSKGKSPNEVFEIISKNKKMKSEDKKYAAKLLFKWKNEMYKNKEVLNFLNQKLDDNVLKYEINNLQIHIETDEIEAFIKNQMKDG